jgi:hypothetical protein
MPARLRLLGRREASMVRAATARAAASGSAGSGCSGRPPVSGKRGSGVRVGAGVATAITKHSELESVCVAAL